MAVPPHGLPEYNRMIPHGADTALMFAARVGDAASARLLVEAGANVNDHDAWGVSATTMAAFSGYGEVARYLLDKGADPNNDKPGFTALHCAIMRRDEPTVAALLARGADPNARVKVWTPTRRSSDDYHFMPALVGCDAVLAGGALYAAGRHAPAREARGRSEGRFTSRITCRAKGISAGRSGRPPSWRPWEWEAAPRGCRSIAPSAMR